MLVNPAAVSPVRAPIMGDSSELVVVPYQFGGGDLLLIEKSFGIRVRKEISTIAK